MRACTEGVMEYILSKEDYADLPKVKANNADVALYATNGHISAVVSSVLSLMKSGIVAQNTWKAAAESVNNVYNKVLKAKEIEKKRSKLLAEKEINEDQYKFTQEVTKKVEDLSAMLDGMQTAVEYCNSGKASNAAVLQVGDGSKIVELDALINAATLKIREWSSNGNQ